MSKALGLMSGGLDSSLAAMVLMRQGIEVTGISFVTPFFNAGKARRASEKLGFPLQVKDISDLHLDMVKAPKYGYGRNMNPCIDCHAMMFRLAGEILQREGFDFLFSGEVLGQRPMSQNANALRSVANHSGFPERVLRPLSAKLLPVTAMEEIGLVERERLLDIQGRSRKRQQALSIEWGYPDYPSSGGGCLLTEERFADRLRDLLQHDPQAAVAEVESLKVGRHFRLSPQAKLLLGRNQQDNDVLENLKGIGYVHLHCADFKGPLGVFCGRNLTNELALAAAIVASYGKGKDQDAVDVIVQRGEQSEERLKVVPLARNLSARMLI